MDSLQLLKISKSNMNEASWMRASSTFIWNFFDEGYRDVGGFAGFHNAKKMIEGIDVMKIVKDVSNNDKIVAMGIYSTYLTGLKCLGATSDKSIIGKDGVKMIIQDDIKNYADFYWAEVSGAPEHWFDKFGGFKMPNVYAEVILNKPIISLDKDGYHYTRSIGISKTEYTKIIYGIPSREIAMRILKEMRDDYRWKDLESWVDRLEKSVDGEVLTEHSSILKKSQEEASILIIAAFYDRTIEWKEEGYILSSKLKASLKRHIRILKNLVDNRKAKDLARAKKAYKNGIEILSVANEFEIKRKFN